MQRSDHHDPIGGFGADPEPFDYNRGLRLGRPSDKFYDFNQLGSRVTLIPSASNEEEQIAEEHGSLGPDVTKEHPPDLPPTKSTKPRCSIWNFWLPLIVVTLPLLPAIWLLCIVCVYRVGRSSPASPVLNSGEPSPYGAFIILDYSASRLLFVSGLASTVAPWLPGCIMTLWIWRIGWRLLRSSRDESPSRLPDARQYAQVLSLTSASIHSLAVYIWHARRRRTRSNTPNVVKRSAFILVTSLVFSVIIIANATALQYTTTTIIVNQARSPNVLGSHSLKLSEDCSTLDRTDNLGMSCSKNNFLSAENPNAYRAQQSEIFALSHNNSDRVETRVVPGTSTASPGTVLVVPKSSRIPPHLDYRALTVGARTSCALITERCHFRLTGPYDNYWAFNCTNAFWGALGKAPPTPFEPQVQDVPPLMIIPTDQLHFAFFQDADLTTIYNSQGANLSDGSLPRFPVAIPDSKLINPVYMGIAARFVLGTQNPEADFSEAPGFFNGTGGWYGFVLSCSYDVRKAQYTWSNGSIIDVEPSDSSNGILAEIYHGFHTPRDPGQLDYNLQDAMVQATMEDNVQGLLKKWSDLLSIQIMSVIGSVLVRSPSIAEEVRSPLLVARIAIPPLALLITACFTYATFGLVVVLVAWSVIKLDVRDLASLISVERLALHAFRQQPGSEARRETGEHMTYGRGQRDGAESNQPCCRNSAECSKIGVERDGNSFLFKVWATVAGSGSLEGEGNPVLTRDGAISTPNLTVQHLASGQNS